MKFKLLNVKFLIIFELKIFFYHLNMKILRNKNCIFPIKNHFIYNNNYFSCLFKNDITKNNEITNLYNLEILKKHLKKKTKIFEFQYFSSPGFTLTLLIQFSD